MNANVMLDLETMGNGSNAAIIAIGAVEFFPETGLLGREFYEVISLESSAANGGVIDASTILWWMQQSAEARAEFVQEGQHIFTALQLFSAWIPEKALVWGNGADFDNVILRAAYNNSGMVAPWKFYNSRCFRTLKNLFPKVQKPVDGPVAHKALDDARWQAEQAILMLQQLTVPEVPEQ